MSADAAKTVSVKLDQETRARIEQLAKKHRRTAHWLMREAIQQYLEREEKRESFRQDAINAWKEYQETGLHVTGSEVSIWLDTWSEENEQAYSGPQKLDSSLSYTLPRGSRTDE
jgi:predicted transcriptional regulator